MTHQSDNAESNTEPLFACDHPGCGRLFKTKFSMKRHTLVHNDVRPYSCKYCGKKFALPQYMKEHTYTHTKDKPYIFGVSGCQKRFRQAGKLSLHRRTHEEYVLKQYDCNPGQIKPVAPSLIPSENNKDQCEEQKIPEVKPQAPVEVTLLEQKCGVRDNSRPLWRQDSGQTAVSMLANDDVGILREVSMSKFASPEPKVTQASGEPRLTRDLLDMHDKMFEQSDALTNYLSHIESSLSISLRPVLPFPKGVTRKTTSNQFSIPDLFELLQKYKKE